MSAAAPPSGVRSVPSRKGLPPPRADRGRSARADVDACRRLRCRGDSGVECGCGRGMRGTGRGWGPAGRDRPVERWWALFAIVGRMLVAMARAIHEADPAASIALSEPWAWHPDLSLADQGRAFDILLGR